MSGDDASGSSSFNTGHRWIGGAKSVAGDTYVIDGGFTMRTPQNGNHHGFEGDKLTIADNGTLMWKGVENGSGSITIPNCVFSGRFTHGSDRAMGVISGNIFIPGDASPEITVDGANWRKYTIDAVLSGNGHLRLNVPPNGNSEKIIFMRGDNSGFTGPATISGTGDNCHVSILSEENLGGNPAEFNPSQLTIVGSMLRFDNAGEIFIDDSNRGICLSNSASNAGSKLNIAGSLVGMGSRAFRDESLRPSPWAPLAASTMRQANRGFAAKKARLSKKKQETAAFIKNPLIDTGAMMRSIRAFEIGERAPGGGYIAKIASDRPYAAFHQFGAKHIPARPFLPIDADLAAGTAILTDKVWNTLKPVLERILQRLIAAAP